MISFQMICQQRAKNLFFFKLRELNLSYNDAKKNISIDRRRRKFQYIGYSMTMMP